MDKIITDINFLRQICQPTTRQWVEEHNLKDRLLAAVKNAWTPGTGLSAIQIGLPVKFAVYVFNKKENILLNPKIIAQDSAHYIKEGCLSIPNKWFNTLRYNHITFESDEQMFSADSVEAWIIQHEIDHMNGILCIDRQVNPYPQLGRNDLCKCGSGKKYKYCHLL